MLQWHWRRRSAVAACMQLVIQGMRNVALPELHVMRVCDVRACVLWCVQPEMGGSDVAADLERLMPKLLVAMDDPHFKVRSLMARCPMLHLLL